MQVRISRVRNDFRNERIVSNKRQVNEIIKANEVNVFLLRELPSFHCEYAISGVNVSY